MAPNRFSQRTRNRCDAVQIKIWTAIGEVAKPGYLGAGASALWMSKPTRSPLIRTKPELISC
jgi:hypothetical protein